MGISKPAKNAAVSATFVSFPQPAAMKPQPSSTRTASRNTGWTYRSPSIQAR